MRQWWWIVRRSSGRAPLRTAMDVGRGTRQASGRTTVTDGKHRRARQCRAPEAGNKAEGRGAQTSASGQQAPLHPGAGTQSVDRVLSGLPSGVPAPDPLGAGAGSGLAGDDPGLPVEGCARLAFDDQRSRLGKTRCQI